MLRRDGSSERYVVIIKQNNKKVDPLPQSRLFAATHSHSHTSWMEYLFIDVSSGWHRKCRLCRVSLVSASSPSSTCITIVYVSYNNIPSNSKANGCFSFTQAKNGRCRYRTGHSAHRKKSSHKKCAVFVCTYQNWKISAPHFASHAFTHDTICNQIRARAEASMIQQSVHGTAKWRTHNDLWAAHHDAQRWWKNGAPDRFK